MTEGYLPPIWAALRHGPWVAGAAVLAVTPVGFGAIAALLERRLLRPRGEFLALILGDPLLAVSVALGAWLLHGAAPGGAAGPPFGLVCMSACLAFGLLQWHAELRNGFYSRAQAISPTKIWHQLVVYPLLGYWVWTADLGGLLTAPAPGPGHDLAKAVICGCVLIWMMANVYDRRHPKLGHPPYDWRRLRPQPSPWPAQSASLRAYLAARGSPATVTVAPEPDLPRHRYWCPADHRGLRVAHRAWPAAAVWPATVSCHQPCLATSRVLPAAAHRACNSKDGSATRRFGGAR